MDLSKEYDFISLSLLIGNLYFFVFDKVNLKSLLDYLTNHSGQMFSQIIYFFYNKIESL